MRARLTSLASGSMVRARRILDSGPSLSGTIRHKKRANNHSTLVAHLGGQTNRQLHMENVQLPYDPDRKREKDGDVQERGGDVFVVLIRDVARNFTNKKLQGTHLGCAAPLIPPISTLQTSHMHE